MSEHSVSVDGNKYTFIIPKNDYKFRILRYGDEWHGPIGEASNAIHSMMCELDAARVVLQAARKLASVFERLPLDLTRKLAEYDEPVGIIRALGQHDRLVGEGSPPSEWTK